jgi:4'-phosphopantetheinyl transferase
MSGDAPCDQTGEVRVWHARASDLLARTDSHARALGWLLPPERARYERFRRDADRAMFLLGRVMARAAVGRALGVAPTAWPWRDSPRGRPEIDRAGCALSFNLAHSGGLVACALARGIEVGVDVEDRARPVFDRQLVARYCAPDEQRRIDAAAGDGWRDLFLKYWTLKEAYLKARGLGIAVPLAELCFTIADGRVQLTLLGSLADADPRWTFELCTIGDRHYLAVAAAVPTGSSPRITVEPFPTAWLP